MLKTLDYLAVQFTNRTESKKLVITKLERQVIKQ